MAPKKKPKKETTTKKVKAKPVKKSRPKGELERKMIAWRKEWKDACNALGAKPKQCKFQIVSNKWVVKAGLVQVKRVKLADAMKEFRKRVKARL